VLPADFEELPHCEPLLAGVFLPRDGEGWLGRREYPARVLLLTGSEVVVAAHPSAREPVVRFPLGLLQSIECGRSLLLGSIVLKWDGGQKRLPYNTCNSGPVDKVMDVIEDRWLPAVPGPEARNCEAFGEPLNLKFEYAQSGELLEGEEPLARFFQPASRRTRRWAVFRRETWSPGDLLLATSRRALWIEERYKGRYERYGTISHSAPLALLAGIRCAAANRRGELQVTFRTGDVWRIPLHLGRESEALKFEAALGRILV
jgi:hypothetical protein